MIAELLGFRTRSILDNPNLNLNDPDTWAAVFGDSVATHSGIPIDHEKALTVAAVWQAVSLISGDVAKLPLDLYKRLPSVSDDAREKFAGHPVAQLIRRRPNREATALKFWRRVMVHILVWGNAYVFIDRDGSGQPIELLPLLPDRTRPKRVSGQLIYETEAGGKVEPLAARNVIHLEGIAADNLAGCDPTHYARNSWALALAREKFASQFFKMGGRVGGLLELPLAISKPAKDRLEEGFRKTYEGGDAAFKTVILRDNAKFHAAQTTPEGSQMVEAGEAQVREVARWFNLPPSKLGLSDSVSYNSKAEDNQAYLDATLAVYLEMIAQECWAKLLTPEEQSELFFEHNTAALLRMNLTDRFAAYRNAIECKILNPNECRARENLLPYEGGDEYENPNTSAPKPDDKPPAPEPKAKEPPSEERPKRSTEDLRLLFNLTGRARHKSRNGAAFIEWIDGGIASMRAEWKAANPAAAEPEFVETFYQRMLAVAQQASADKLSAAVDAACKEIENV